MRAALAIPAILLAVWGGGDAQASSEASILSPTGCGNDGLSVLLNASAALAIESAGGKSWVAIATVETEGAAGSLVLTVEGEDGELILPPADAMEECDSVPGLLPVLFAEAVAVFKKLDPQCYAGRDMDARCVAAVFDTIDISGDGVFSRAELSRAVRAAGFFIGHRIQARNQSVSFVPLEDMLVVQIAASALGPFIAGNLIESYDFDGDGRLAPGELMQDRLPEDGIEGFVAGVAMEMSPDMLAALMKPLTGILEVLK